MSANALQIQLHTEQPLIERLLPSQRTLEIIVRPPAAAQSNARPPLNLALVLDRKRVIRFIGMPGSFVDLTVDALLGGGGDTGGAVKGRP